MHIHILGICGTFMGGIALIAQKAGFKVTGSDKNVYPPMSTELETAGIKIYEGYGAEQLDVKPDLIVVGNVMKRGMPVIERMLNERIPYVSGPQWLEEHYLLNKKVLAVAGTHGKTTTTAMLAWILEANDLNPGFLVGGIPENFGYSARATESPYFVIEADEYDCAFFDKRSKFLHYHPFVQILNNLEFDHADIFNSLDDIKKQFHHLVRTVPGNGTIVMPYAYPTLEDVLKMGVWTPVKRIGGKDGLHAKLIKQDGSVFAVYNGAEFICEVNAQFCGEYNVNNALMAAAAAAVVGVDLKKALLSLETYKMPKRRMEYKGCEGNVVVYDDFAHHPTAIKLTLNGLRAKVGKGKRIVAVFEPRSNSMKMGANKEFLAESFASADEAFIYAPKEVVWDVESLEEKSPTPLHVEHDFDVLLNKIVSASPAGSTVLVMSNGGFNGIHQKLLALLKFR